MCQVMMCMYTDIAPHNWAQAVESFELNYDFMHMYYWKFHLFVKYVNTSASIF